MERRGGRTQELWAPLSGKCMFIICPFPVFPCSFSSSLDPECSFLFPLIMFTDSLCSNSRLMLPFHSSSFAFFSWFKAFRMLWPYHNLNRHLTKSWSLSPRASMLLLLGQMTVRESSESTKGKGDRIERSCDLGKRRNGDVIDTACCQ